MRDWFQVTTLTALPLSVILTVGLSIPVAGDVMSGKGPPTLQVFAFLVALSATFTVAAVIVKTRRLRVTEMTRSSLGDKQLSEKFDDAIEFIDSGWPDAKDGGWKGSGWYFWDQEFTRCHGPYPNREKALASLKAHLLENHLLEVGGRR